MKIEKIALEVVDVDGLGRFTLRFFRKDLNEEQLKNILEYLDYFLQKIYLVDYKIIVIKISKSLAQKN